MPTLPSEYGKRRGPLHRVVAIVRLVLERVPLAFGRVAAAHVLDDDDVSAGGGLQSESGVAVLVVGRALEEHGKACRPRGPVDVGAKRHAVAHLHGHVRFVGDAGTRQWRLMTMRRAEGWLR